MTSTTDPASAAAQHHERPDVADGVVVLDRVGLSERLITQRLRLVEAAEMPGAVHPRRIRQTASGILAEPLEMLSRPFQLDHHADARPQMVRDPGELTLPEGG